MRWKRVEFWVPVPTLTFSPRSRIRTQFSLRAFLLVIVALGTLCGLASIKIHQDLDRRTAFHDLSTMGVASMLGRTCEFTWTRPAFSDNDLNKFAATLDILTRRHDLGISDGLRIDVIDFSGSRVGTSAAKELRQRFPSAEIRY